MDTFSKAGEAMLMAQEGNRQIAAALVALFHSKLTDFKAWLASMPTTLPPTESNR